MGIDKSLIVKGRLAGSRSVLRRAERIKLLETEGKWSEEKSVFGLPKVKTVRLKKRAKAEKAPPKETEGAVTPEVESTGE